jgi:energy-coupling factor transporter ATP-binding protein EcfA2
MSKSNTTRRKGIISLIIGKRHTGKSTFLYKLIEQVAPKKKILIYDTQLNDIYKNIPIIPIDELDKLKEWGKGVYRIVHQNQDITYKEIFNFVGEHTKDMVLIVEDASKYLGKNPKGALLNLMLSAKQNGHDIILVFHFWGSIAREVYGAANRIEVFKSSSSSIKRYEDKIPNYDEVVAVFEKVQKSRNQFYHQTAPL